MTHTHPVNFDAKWVSLVVRSLLYLSSHTSNLWSLGHMEVAPNIIVSGPLLHLSSYEMGSLVDAIPSGVSCTAINHCNLVLMI